MAFAELAAAAAGTRLVAGASRVLRACERHDFRGGAVLTQKARHDAHGGLRVPVEELETRAKIIMVGFARAGRDEPILWAAAIAQGTYAAIAALLR